VRLGPGTRRLRRLLGLPGDPRLLNLREDLVELVDHEQLLGAAGAPDSQALAQPAAEAGLLATGAWLDARRGELIQPRLPGLAA
jgi:hypothetical protein